MLAFMSDEELGKMIRVAFRRKDELEKSKEKIREKYSIVDSHLKTLISALSSPDCPMHTPSQISLDATFEPVFVKDKKPFYLMNIGTLPSKNQLQFYISGVVYPVNYKILRKFKKNLFSKSIQNEVFYTTTVSQRGESKYYKITDDEGNSWTDLNAFSEFSNSFNGAFLFQSMEEWLGLENQDIQKRIALLNGYEDLMKHAKSGGVLESYFTR